MFAIDRDEEGRPKLAPPAAGKTPTAKDWFERRCYLLGITEREKVERLWREKLEAQNPKSRP